VKRRDAIELVKTAIGKLVGKEQGPLEVNFVSVASAGSPPERLMQESAPEFEFGGWRFYAKTELWDDEPTDDGDAKVVSPDGTFFGLAWTADGTLSHEFDFSPSFGPMLYVQIPSPVLTWEELRQQLVQLLPALDNELKGRKPPDSP
jgi:hypothetical protein